MARPKTKDELVAWSRENFARLNDFIDSFSAEEQAAEFRKGTLNRNIRDVLAHLHHWHLLMLNWHKTGMQGDKPEMPAKGYTWKTTSELNRAIRKKYQNAKLKKIQADLNGSYRRLQDVIQKHSDEELFEKKRYPWTGSTSLGAYLVSATSSHYDWAYKLIKKAKKT